MRNWMLITTVATVVGVGGLVYYVFPHTSPDAPGMAPQIVVQPEQRSGNPLLTATAAQFNVWFPDYCQAELYIEAKESHLKKVCIRGVMNRVEKSTGIRLTQEDILNVAVVTHWKTIERKQ